MRVEEKILELLADEHSRRILQFTLWKHETAEMISIGLKIPLSTVYRKLRELRKAGLLVVEKSMVTKDGKICDLHRSTIKGIKIQMDTQPPSIDLVFNEDVYNKISRVWQSLRKAR